MSESQTTRTPHRRVEVYARLAQVEDSSAKTMGLIVMPLIILTAIIIALVR